MNLKFEQGPIEVNDVHSALNRTPVSGIWVPQTEQELANMVAKSSEELFAICGNRHAMGGQQFARNKPLIDCRSLCGLQTIDKVRGVATFGAGTHWLRVQTDLAKHFDANGSGWTFRQKQTGADRLSLGGAVSVNAHGRGLNLKAFVEDVESLKIVNAEGQLLNLSRTENSELFGLVCGGYGLFGVITSVSLRLRPRVKLARHVEICMADEAIPKLMQQHEKGYEYGDFQFRIDNDHPHFLQMGVLSSYEPVIISSSLPASQKELSFDDWYSLLKLAHLDKSAAFEKYTQYYLSTSGQIYWSDLHQMNIYPDGYHTRLDVETGAVVTGSEMISELYVPRDHLPAFLKSCAVKLKSMGANVIYGTVRLIKSDCEAYLTWARHDWACIIFNLHVDHSPKGLNKARSEFGLLIDIALDFGGSYFLTYHRWATREQLLKAHPKISTFLELKDKYDPRGVFGSDWCTSVRNLVRHEK